MTHLIDFNEASADLRVMFHHNGTGHDVGSAFACIGDDLPRVEVGASQGADNSRGAYDWWPLTVDGHAIGELRDDASGMTIHVTPDTWMSGIGLLLPDED